MEYDINLNEESIENEDIIYTKIISSLKDSKNILHKKANILIKSIHSQYDAKKLIGIDGVQLYTKTFIDLLIKIVNKYAEINEKNLEEDELIEDTLNFEALIFSLAICCKHLNNKILHNTQFIQRIINIINFSIGIIKSKKIIFRVNNYCYKYILNIIEAFLLSRNDEELSNDKDEIVLFFKTIYMKILIICMRLKPDSNYQDEYDVKNININVKDLQSSLLKIIVGLIQKKKEKIQFSIIYEVISYIINQIKNINSNLKILNNNQDNKGSDLISNKILNTVNKNEITNSLLFLSGLIQFLSYDFFNDVLKELISLIQNINPEEDIEEKNDMNINIMINCLLCIDLSFNTHELSEDINERTLTILLNKNIFTHFKNSNKDEFDEDKEENSKNKKYKVNGDIYDKLIIAYLKAISSIVLKVCNNDYFKSLQYFIAILSKYSEVLIESNSFVKNSIFSVLQNLIQKLFDVKNISKLKIFPQNNNIFSNKNKINLENLDINENKKEEITENIILSKVVKILLYFVSSRFTEKKIGYNLLILFIEKINQAKKINNYFYQHINQLNEEIILSMCELNYKDKSDLHKIFIGKCFNYINSTTIFKYYHLGILDYDIEKEDYTDSSNVWIISYINKFLLKENCLQTIEDYTLSFIEPINEIEHMIVKMKILPFKSENGENMEIQEDEDNDEKFEVNVNETKHMRELKIKRYQLILTQIYMQIIKFTNYCNKYYDYIKAFLIKFKEYYDNKDSCHFLITNLNEITFKFLYKIIQVVIKNNDQQSIQIIRETGVFFFEKILNLILNDKLNKSDISLGFNVISKFCLVLSKQNIIKIIIDMIQKFDNKINSIFNNSNEKEKNNKGVIETSKKQKEKNDKEMNKLAIRLEIADYMLKNLDFVMKSPNNGNNNNSDEDNMNSIILQFFDKYFFFFSENKNVKISKEGISSLQPLLTKKLFEIFYDIITKCNDIDYILSVFNKFTSEKKGLSLITSKQQSKILEFIINKIITKNEPLKNISFNNLNITLELIIAIDSLTKDINKKVRNASFEIIGNITSFCTKHNLLDDWIKINISLLSSKNAFVESAGINSLSRIFWENRNLEKNSETIISNSEAVLAYFPYNNKEIIKSLFLYIRVLLYVIKTTPPKNKKSIDTIVHKVIFSTTQQMNEQMQKEFKVKLRNLFKNLIINYGYDYVKGAIDTKNENLKNLIQYVNKTIVKKFNNNQEKEENEKLDNTVMMDNENNLLDEEEDYIKNEFKKINKPDKEIEKKFFQKIEKLNIADDDLDDLRKKELESLKKDDKKEEKIEKIEELFIKDYVNFNNFFYVNPFASGNNIKYDEQKINREKKEEKNKKELKEKDVLYDAKQGKFIIKDLEKEIEISKLSKKRKRQAKLEKEKELEYQDKELEKQAAMKGKKVKNIMKDDLYDLKKDDSDEDDENVKKSRKKISEKEYKKISTPQTGVDSHGKKTSHYVKYSGEEYKSKKGKGDKIIQGKYDPFAYIQLNPKSLNSKGERENAKIWANLMKNDNK